MANPRPVLPPASFVPSFPSFSFFLLSFPLIFKIEIFPYFSVRGKQHRHAQPDFRRRIRSLRGNSDERNAGAHQRGVDKFIATLPAGFAVTRIIQLYHANNLQSPRIAYGKIDVLRCDAVERRRARAWREAFLRPNDVRHTHFADNAVSFAKDLLEHTEEGSFGRAKQPISSLVRKFSSASAAKNSLEDDSKDQNKRIGKNGARYPGCMPPVLRISCQPCSDFRLPRPPPQSSHVHRLPRRLVTPKHA